MNRIFIGIEPCGKLRLAEKIGSKNLENTSETPKRFRHYKEIYIGHTPTPNYGASIPMKAYNVWNLDTGAGFGGKLTAMDISTKQFWQSDLLPELYSNEKGRN